MSDVEPASYGERVALFEALPSAFTLDQIVEAGASLGYPAYKTFSCLHAYQMSESVVQQGEKFVKHGGAGPAQSG